MSLIARFLDGFTALHEYPGDIATPILIPGDLDPHERHEDRWDWKHWHFGEERSVDEDDREPWWGDK